jgi:deoxycytidylate deaminase
MMKYTIMRDLELIGEEFDFSISPIKKYAPTMMSIAREMALISKCPDGKQHACVLAIDGAYIVSTGYNGPSSRMRHCEQCNYSPSDTLCPAIHAEENAIINLARNGGGGTIDKNVVAYITKRPCKHCLEILLNTSIVTLVF